MDFTRAQHTVVVSDMHLSDAEPVHPRNPLWKLFKRREHFVDESFRRFLEYIRASIADGTRPQAEVSGEPIELILNGDIFDFDSVMAIPKDPTFSYNWLEKLRGLAAEERKSRFKIGVILKDHPVFVETLRGWVMAGHRVVFVIGNHDIELHWPSVRLEILDVLNLPEDRRKQVRFCEWFYISNQDTLIEHGNQYDPYCLCHNPIHPLIPWGISPQVRLPFGNLANKIMLNGMGLMNPHVDSSYIRGSIWEYLVFYYRYIMRTQPFLMWTWFWSAMVTIFYSVGQGLSPAITNPLTIGVRVEDIAARANAHPRIVWPLKELSVHPAIFNPLRILRELWLDRAFLLVLIFVGSAQVISLLNTFVIAVSLWWLAFPIALLLPLFVFYSRSVESEIAANIKAMYEKVPMSAQIAQVRRVIHGHTHRELHTSVEGVEYLNTGTWSSAYHDVECKLPYGRKCFAWIKPGTDREAGLRTAELHEWKDPGSEPIAPIGRSG